MGKSWTDLNWPISDFGLSYSADNISGRSQVYSDVFELYQNGFPCASECSDQWIGGSFGGSGRGGGGGGIVDLSAGEGGGGSQVVSSFVNELCQYGFPCPSENSFHALGLAAVVVVAAAVSSSLTKQLEIEHKLECC